MEKQQSADSAVFSAGFFAPHQCLWHYAAYGSALWNWEDGSQDLGEQRMQLGCHFGNRKTVRMLSHPKHSPSALTQADGKEGWEDRGSRQGDELPGNCILKEEKD